MKNQLKIYSCNRACGADVNLKTTIRIEVDTKIFKAFVEISGDLTTAELVQSLMAKAVIEKLKKENPKETINVLH